MADILWSELRMEDGNPPGPNDVVVVNSGDRLIFDGGAEAATVEGLVIYGTFEVEDGDTPLELTTDWAVVVDGGTFKVGSPEDPYAGEFDLTLAGKDNRNDVDLSDYPDMGPGNMHMGHGGMSHSDHVIRDNNAYLMAMGEGSSIEIHVDDAEKESWTQLSRTAESGDAELFFSEQIGWEVGDKIAVASTDFDLNQSEEFTIVGVSNDGRTVTLDRPLEYMHYGSIDTYNDPDGDVHQLDMRAEVALISRDVTIRGDVDYDEDVPLNQQDDQYGGHTMAMMGGEIYMSGVEMAYMGQAGILGRYPVHWHESGDVSGQYIENSSIHHSFNKGITVHNTQGALVSDNVVYETISHNYYLEERETEGNVLTGNLGMNAREVGRFGEIRGANDDNPSNFYTPNGDNTWIGNHAAGSEDKGFYFSLRFDTSDLGVVRDNSAHSVQGQSLYLNHQTAAQDTNPQGSAVKPQKVDPWTVEGFTSYKNNTGVYVQGVEGTFTDSAFAELNANGRFRLNATIENSLIVGRSENVGNPQTRAEIEAGRSLPESGNFQGWQLYDGPGSLGNVMFDGFTEGDNAIEDSNAIHKSSSFGLEGITFGEDVAESAKFSIGGGGNAYGNDNAARGLVDVDGSISGIEGAMIYMHSTDRNASEGFNAGEEYEINRDWGTIITTSGEQSATITFDKAGTPETNDGRNAGLPFSNLNVTRSDGEYANGVRQQVPVFDGYVYEIDYNRVEDEQFRIYMGDADWGQSFIVNLGPVPTTSSFTVDDPYSDASRPAREVSSYEMLEASPDTAVYRDENGEVHIKLVAEMAHGYLWPQPGVAMEGSLNSGVTVLVDTEADMDLDDLEFDDPRRGEELGPPPYPTMLEDDEPDVPMPPADMPDDHGDVPMPPADMPDDEPDMPMPPMNEAPRARNDRAETGHNETIRVDVLANDRDPDGDELTLVDVSYDGDTSRVRITNDGQILVNPRNSAKEERTEVMTYTVADSSGATATGTLRVDVAAAEEDVEATPAPPAPEPTPPEPEPQPEQEPPAPAPLPDVDLGLTFTLVDAEADTIISTLENGGTVTVDNLDTAMNVVVTTTVQDVGSMVITTADGSFQIENFAPYAAFGNSGSDFFGRELSDGDQSLTVAIYSEPNGGGALIGEETFDFSIAELQEEPDSVLSFYLADADTDETLGSLMDGAAIDADTLTDETTFYALSDSEEVSFVTLTFEGEESTERVEPYALFGDRNGNFLEGLDLDPGQYTLEAEAFDDDDNLIETVALQFEVV